MKCILALTLVAAAVADDAAEFSAFKATHGRSYATADEEAMRFTVFQGTLRSIEALNAARVGKNDAVFGVNKFSDLTPAEFKASYLTYQKPAGKGASYLGVANFHTPESLNATAVDWRTKQTGVVSAVKDQGQCGSCWAYSATEQIESNYVLSGKSPVALSPQQIVSCDKTDLGCNGGNTETAYEYVQKAGGIATEKSYPDTSARSGKTGSCSRSFTPSVSIKGYTHVVSECQSGSCNNQDEDGMASNVAAHAPASICVNAEQWQSYRSGVLTGKQCGGHSADDLDHCVQTVGYSKSSVGGLFDDDESGDDKPSPTPSANGYWMVRNSWNTDWGIDGYIHVEYGTNACGIANDATFVTF